VAHVYYNKKGCIVFGSEMLLWIQSVVIRDANLFTASTEQDFLQHKSLTPMLTRLKRKKKK